MSSEPSKIVYFDGVCGMCNRSVDFVLSRDRVGEIVFTPLQGEYAKQNLSKERIDNLNTIVYQDEYGNHIESEAILRILRDMGGWWRLAYGLVIIPRFIRDWVYREIALSRYKLFGKREACRLPNSEERARFLD
ncbi:MAG: DCC1-like thiol-disulfide oxidoreductase family protein [Verrucomicrobiota bacterium]